MCCLLIVLGLLGPRVAFLFTWLFTTRVTVAFGGEFWIPALGLVFLPWTALFYVFAFAPIVGVSSVGWVFVAFGFVLDIATYSSRAAQRRFYSEA
jgi:hypothetical protein